MRVLLDECLPKRLKSRLGGHECKTTPEMGWAGKSNGELLGLAAPQFDVLITIDAGIQYQQNLSNTSLSIVLLHARSNIGGPGTADPRVIGSPAGVWARRACDY
jgi:hypothetical protein